MRKKEELAPLVRCDSGITEGLSSGQVNERVLHQATNNYKATAEKSYLRIVCKNIFTLFNLIWAVMATILISIGHIGDCFFLVVVFANTAIGIIQEVKAKMMIDKLSLISSPTISVVRNGETVEIPIFDVVLDDILSYQAGDQIATDGIVKSGVIYVNESMLTGESVSIKKVEGDSIYAGSYITSGKAYAIADKVGRDNYISTLTQKAKKLKSSSSQIFKSLNTLLKVILIAFVPATILIFVRNYTTTQDIILSIRNTSGGVLGIIPAGIFLLTSVALAVGMIKLARNKTLVQDLYCIEMLARCNVLCLDKTGTITDGTMKVSDFVSLSDNHENIKEILGAVVIATGDNNATANALKDYFINPHNCSVEAVLPFSSEKKYSGATLSNYGTFAIGASEFVLKSVPTKILDQIINFATEGKRVLLVAHSQKSISDDKLPSDMSPCAIIAIEDHIREDAVSTINWFKNNDVEIKIISGDNPITVSHIAKRVGVEGAEKFISLENMSNEQVKEIANSYTVFGRVTPDQKSILVQSMKNSGKTVAMTGDGVNDILAFKEADCSVAMASGSDAAKNIASLVLVDSNFANMPKVVAEGRRVVNNIQNSACMYIMKTIFVLLMIVGTLGRYPFTTKNMMALEFFVIAIPTFFLALQPNKERIKGNFLFSIIKYALPFAIVMFVVAFTIGFVAGAPQFNATKEQITTMQVYAFTFTGFVMLILICVPFNIYRGILVFASLGGAILFALLFKPYLEISDLTFTQSTFVALCVSLSLPLGIALKFLVSKIKFTKFNNIN